MHHEDVGGHLSKRLSREIVVLFGFSPVREDTFQSKNGRVASGENSKTPHRAQSIRQRAWNREQSIQSYLGLSP